MLDAMKRTLRDLALVAGFIILLLTGTSAIYGATPLYQADWLVLTTNAEWDKRDDASLVRFDNYFYLYGGNHQDYDGRNGMWRALYGSTWELLHKDIPPLEDPFHLRPTGQNRAFKFKNRVISFSLNTLSTVLVSDEGDPTTFAEYNTSIVKPGLFTSTIPMTFINTDDVFYVITAYDSAFGNYTDKVEVHKTENGIDWEVVTKNVSIPPRVLAAGAEYGGILNVFGGVAQPLSSGIYFEDVWWSADGGETWQKKTVAVPYPKNDSSIAFTLDNKLWLWVSSPDELYYTLDTEIWVEVDIGGATMASRREASDVFVPIPTNVINREGYLGFLYTAGGFTYTNEDVNDVMRLSIKAYQTPTPTVTQTVTPTTYVVSTRTNTPTRTNTATVTPTATATRTITPTSTPTSTRTTIPTVTDSPTVSPTASVTETITETHTITETWTVSSTPMNSPTITPILTPYIRYVSSGEAAKYPLDSIKLEWAQVPDANYDLYYKDRNQEITWVNTLTNADNESSNSNRFIYRLESLILGNLYDLWIKLYKFDETYTSNTIQVRPNTTPTFEPTPLSFCFSVCEGDLDTPATTNSTSFVDTGLTCQTTTTQANEPVFIYAAYSVSSGSGARVASHRIVNGGEVGTQLNRYLSGTNDIGVGGIVSVLYPTAPGVNHFKLQHKSDSSAGYVTTIKGDIIAVPLESSDGAIQLPNSHSTLDATGTTIAGNTYVDASSLTGTVTLEVPGKILVGAALNVAWGDADTTTRTGYWQILANATPIGVEVGRYIGAAADEGAVVLVGLTDELAAGTHNIVIQHRADVPTLAIKTYNGRIACVGLAVAEGAAYGSFIHAEKVAVAAGVTTTSQVLSSISTASIDFTVSLEGGGFVSMSAFNSLAGDTTGNSRTVTFRSWKMGTAVSSTLSRYLTGATLGAVNTVGYRANQPAGTYTIDIQQATDNSANPVVAANINHVVVDTCIQARPSPTPVP